MFHECEAGLAVIIEARRGCVFSKFLFGLCFADIPQKT